MNDDDFNGIELAVQILNAGRVTHTTPTPLLHLSLLLSTKFTVKSSGCEKRIDHESDFQEWKSMFPVDVSEAKLGAMSPRRRGILT